MDQMQTGSTAQNTPLRADAVVPPAAKDIADNKDLAALSYVWILAVVVYVTRRDSPFIRFHARQGIAIFVLSVGAWFIPYVAKPLELLLLLVAASGFVAAARGQWKDMPLIGPLSRGDWKAVGASVSAFIADVRFAATSLVARLHTMKGHASQPSAIPHNPVPTGQNPPTSVPSQP